MSLRMGLEVSKDSDYLELCPSVSCCGSRCALTAADLATRQLLSWFRIMDSYPLEP